MFFFYFQGLLSLGIITTLLLLANSDDTHANKTEKYPISDRMHQSRNKEETITTTLKDTNDADEKEGAESSFVPSFGPLQPSEYYYNPLYFHKFSPSLIMAYRYMSNHGYPYACAFPYSKYVTPFVSSPLDSYLGSHKPAISYHPHGHVGYPYAEDYTHYLPYTDSYRYPYPTHFFGVELHAGSLYSRHHDYYSYLQLHQPPISVPSRSVPHDSPRAFHSVVNYGHIDLHHGDHFEPHNNGRVIPYLPYHYTGELKYYSSKVFEKRWQIKFLPFTISSSIK
jgi:hypothetical protein